MCNKCNETPNDGYGSGFGGASSRRQAEYFKRIHAMYERDEADRKHKEIITHKTERYIL